MNDMRVIGALILTALLAIGLLCAKAFGFSVAWVLWPWLGALLLVGAVLYVMSEWAP